MTAQDVARQLRWDRRFLDLAGLVAGWSKDPSTRVGCCVTRGRIVLALGYNGLPRGVRDTRARLEDRALKLQLIVHAEQNAILHAGRAGVSLVGGTAYATWPPCCRCAVSWIQAGVVRVVWPACEVPDRWRRDFDLAVRVMVEAGVGCGPLWPGG